MNQTLTIILWFTECLAAITAWLHWHKVKHDRLQWFVIFLTGIALVEGWSLCMQQLHWLKPIHPVFTYVVIPLEFLFYYWLFGGRLVTSQQRLTWALAFMYIFSLVLESIDKAPFRFMQLSYTLGNLFILVVLLLFLLHYVRSEAILQFTRDSYFYIMLGVLIFFTVSFPFFALRNYLYYNYKSLYMIYAPIVTVLNCIMYLLFTISFLCRPKKY